jgi:hypothetical protein
MDGKNDHTNKIKVRKYEWVSDSIPFGYYVFEISKISDTYPIVETVYTRRFSEIEWLHNNLLKSAAGCKIPYIPEKNLLVNYIKSDSVIKDRRDQIEAYLNYVNNHKFLSQNKFFKLFFDNHNFEKQKEEIQSKRSYIQSFKNYLGYSNR